VDDATSKRLTNLIGLHNDKSAGNFLSNSICHTHMDPLFKCTVVAGIFHSDGYGVSVWVFVWSRMDAMPKENYQSNI